LDFKLRQYFLEEAEIWSNASRFRMRMRIAIRKHAGQLANGTIKIGAVARHFGISVDLLRLYEREGLLIPLKSPRGTRYFTEHDFAWIGTILRLVREARLNFAGIRRLLALLPCWEIRQCGYARRAGCKVIQDSSQPCWVNRACYHGDDACPQQPAPVLTLRNGQQTPPARTAPNAECYFCPVYRSARSCENLKALLAVPPELNCVTAVGS
jgi:MerR family transcriptional regulator/heat shock protein HspR